MARTQLHAGGRRAVRGSSSKCADGMRGGAGISLYASINSAPSYYEGGKWYSYMASLSVFDGSL